MGCWSGVKGLAAVERQAPAEHVPRSGKSTAVPGYRGHPPRPQLVRAERGNPVGVRRRFGVCGKPTVRDAQLPGGNRMTEKPMPAAETQRKPGHDGQPLQLAVPHNRPDTGSGARARKRADAVR
jgi:hypothetical protein